MTNFVKDYDESCIVDYDGSCIILSIPAICFDGDLDSARIWRASTGNDIHYHDDGERYYYAMNYTGHDDLSQGASITGIPDVDIQLRGKFDSDLVVEQVAVSGLYVGMWISGGASLQTHKVTVSSAFSDGKIIEGDGYIKVGD